MTKNQGQDPALARIKAETLIESLPWLQNFHGKVVVIKFGGNAMVDEQLTKAFAQDMAYLRFVGIKPVVVHGGGPQITARLAELGIQTEFRSGLRVTTAEVMTVVKDVLRNQISAGLAGFVQAAGAKALVLSGEDSDLFIAKKTTQDITGNALDVGLVGEVAEVNPGVVIEALAAGVVPIISSVAPASDGQLLNVNADLAAASLAVALGAEKLLLLTDVAGLYRNWPIKDSLISEIRVAELVELLPQLESGMIPKMQACLNALAGDVPRAHIIDGRAPHSILLEIFTSSGVGTLVLP
jgi:acetylglutamate kinase